MIDANLVQVVILWCVTGVGIICAMNARGLLRQLVSWFIVIAMIATAAFFSYMKIESVKQEIGLTSALDTRPVMSFAPANRGNDTLAASYTVAEKQIFESIIAISDSIIAFPNWKDIYSQGIEKRENFESKALFLRNKSMNSYRQIRNLTPPDDKKPSYDTLLAAAENLRLAGYEVHYQFSLEADTLGESIIKAREYASQVKSVVFSIMNKE